MKKNKKVTFNMIVADMKAAGGVTDPGILKIGELSIPVKHTLSLDEAMGFVSDIVESCVDMEAAEYTPEGFDMAVRINMMTYYAGVDAPKDLAKAYSVVYDESLREKLLGLINLSQANALIAAADNRIRHMREIMVSASTKKINELIYGMDSALNESMSVMERLSSDDMKQMVDRIADIRRYNSVQDTAANTSAPADTTDSVVRLMRKQHE